MRTLPLAALLLSLPTAAAARPTLALRLGWATASGDASKGSAMSEVVKSEIPIQLDALWRFGPHFSGGLYSSYGFGQLSKDISDRCDSLGASCSSWTMRLGVQGQYAFTERSPRWAPWLGVGSGLEWVHEKAAFGGQTGSQTMSGWEIFNLEGGADVKVAPSLTVGAYASFRLGLYTRLDGYSVANKGYHDWLGLGIRGKWDL
jgi:hypothetical protein